MFSSKSVLSLALICVSARAATAPLTLKDYLDKVKANHLGYQGSRSTGEGAEIRSREGELLLSPSFFANIQKTSDAKPTMNPSFMGDKTIFDAYSIGFSKMTRFGLLAKLSYNVNYTAINGVNPAFIPFPQFYDAKPMLELNQSLWRNFFGRETRAQVDLQTAAAKAVSYSENYRSRMILMDAEMTYWRLILARETVQVQEESLSRFQKIESWISGRVKQDLSDKSDLYQASTAVEGRQLELEAARDEAAAAARAFNSLIGQTDDKVSAQLQKLEPKLIDDITIPKRAQQRDDVKAAEQSQAAAVLSGKLTMEKSYPTFDIFGAVAFNGRDPSFGVAASDSFKSTRPTYMAGIKFSTGLDVFLASDIRDGYVKEQLGAELNYKRKLFEQDREWDDLNRKLADGKKRLDLAFAIEKAQHKKLDYEQDRHKRGRSTTYQVLLFEQDYANAQLMRIRSQADLLRIVAQMKTFGEGTL